MTTRLDVIEQYAREAVADGPLGEVLLPAAWAEQLVQVARAADRLVDAAIPVTKVEDRSALHPRWHALVDALTLLDADTEATS